MVSSQIDFCAKKFFFLVLFFSGAENYVVRASDRGNGRVHMTRVSCNSMEPDLTKCRYRLVLTSSLHYRDVGVRCYSGGKEFYLNFYINFSLIL